MTVRKVTVELEAKITGWRSGMKAAGQDAKALRGEVSGMAKDNKAAMMDIERTAGIAGAALAGLAGWAIKAGMDFDKQMSEVQAITGETASGLQTLRQAALDAGQATMYSATQAAEAEANLAKAGLSTADILGGALDGALALAAAGSLDLAQAADIAAKSMSQFGLEGKDVKHVADLLAGGANATATDVGELGQALAQGGGAAHAAGFSFEDTVTVLGAMTKAAIVGSDAGTSLKTMLLRLEAPTKEAKGMMEQYGISLYDANGYAVDAYTLAGQLRTSLSGLTQQRRNEVLATIFGSDAQRSANALYEVGEQGLRRMNKQILDQADASKVAAVKTDNLAGDIERLKGSLETLFITSSEGSNGGLRMIVEALDHLVNMVTDLPGPVKTAALLIAGLSGTGLLAAVGFLKLRRTLMDTFDAMRQGGPRMTAAANGMERMTRIAGKATLALSALSVAAYALHKFTDTETDVQGLSDAVKGLAVSGEASGELVRMFGKNLETLKEDAAAASSGFSEAGQTIEYFTGNITELVTGGSFTSAAENFKTLDQVLADTARSGNAETARIAYVKLMQAAHLTADQMEKLTPTYQNAITEAEKLAPATGKVTDKLNAQEEQILTLTDAWKALHDVQSTADDKMLAAKRSIHDITDAFKEGTRSVKGNSEAALENRVALEQGAQAAIEAADAYLANGGTQEGATKIMAGFKDEAIKATGATGSAKVQVKKLADELYKLPPETKVKIVITAEMRAAGNQATAWSMLRASERRWGGIVEHARAGLLKDAHVAGGKQTLYAYNEPATGGEAFVPKRGNYGRSMGILGKAASWYGADVVPRAYRGGMGGGDVQVTVTPVVANGAGAAVVEAVTERMRFDVRTKHAGSAQTYLGPRRGQ